jgi:alpha-L-fucosidase
MKKLHIILLCTLQLFGTSIFAQKTYQPNWQSIDSRPVPTWFEDAKFGIFIHWGLYSVPAYSPTKRDKVGVYEQYAEWYWSRWLNPSKTQQFFIDYHNRVYGKDFKYQNFANLFKAEMFNPDEWAERFKEAGAKYILLTSKHNEGFTLWPSAQSWNWNSVDVGPHRDLCGDLTKSVKASGLQMGFYYSLYEWFNRNTISRNQIWRILIFPNQLHYGDLSIQLNRFTADNNLQISITDMTERLSVIRLLSI